VERITKVAVIVPYDTQTYRFTGYITIKIKDGTIDSLIRSCNTPIRMVSVENDVVVGQHMSFQELLNLYQCLVAIQITEAEWFDEVERVKK